MRVQIIESSSEQIIYQSNHFATVMALNALEKGDFIHREGGPYAVVHRTLETLVRQYGHVKIVVEPCQA